MYQPKLEKDIRCRWNTAWIFSAENGNPVSSVFWQKKQILRYSSLRKEMMNITDAVLASTLKELIADQIVNRQSYDEIPPRVEYSLTERGRSVVPILQSICRWSGAYHREDSEHIMAQCQKCDYHFQ